MNKLKLGVMQAYFIPYLGYFQLIKSVDKFILYENLPFRKKSWMSRNRILFAGGGEQYLIVPVREKNSNTLTRDIEVSYPFDWKQKLLQSLTNTYRLAAYFDEAYPVIEKLLLFDDRMLHEYNSRIIRELCAVLMINTELIHHNDDLLGYEAQLWDCQAGKNVDEQFTFEKQKRIHQRIFELCRKEQAAVYINAPGGTELYLKSEFAEQGIELKFLQPALLPYQQFAETFTPGLSIVDVLMHNGISRTAELVCEYTLA
jgi:hypothetical protein